MKNIQITRIDDRLIHGQVVTAWIKTYPVNKIIIIDNELAQNKLMERIYKAAAPQGVVVSIFDLPSATAFLFEEPLKNENIMILVKVPETLEHLIQEGIKITRVILGGMGAKPGRKSFNRNISASEEEVQSFKNLIEQGVEMIYQMVPNDRPVNVKTLL